MPCLPCTGGEVGSSSTVTQLVSFALKATNGVFVGVTEPGTVTFPHSHHAIMATTTPRHTAIIHPRRFGPDVAGTGCGDCLTYTGRWVSWRRMSRSFSSFASTHAGAIPGLKTLGRSIFAPHLLQKTASWGLLELHFWHVAIVFIGNEYYLAG